MHFTTNFLLAAGAVSSVSAHGLMTSPTPRAVGDATSAACGSQVAAIIKGDPTSHVEGLPEAAATDSGFDASKCNLFLCKGLQFADNTQNVMALTPGQSLELKFSIPIPHEGPCNVSVVDTKTNTLISTPLINFDSYADESLPALPKNNTDMTVTVPTDLGNKCAVAGDCVIQWFWFGTAADQTYESCLDFTISGSSSGGSSTSTSSSTSAVSVAETVISSSTSTSAVATTSSTAVAATLKSNLTSSTHTKTGEKTTSVVSVTSDGAVGFSRVTITPVVTGAESSTSAETATSTSTHTNTKTASKTSTESVTKSTTTPALAGTGSSTKNSTLAGSTSKANTTAPLFSANDVVMVSPIFNFGDLKVVVGWLIAANALMLI